MFPSFLFRLSIDHFYLFSSQWVDVLDGYRRYLNGGLKKKLMNFNLSKGNINLLTVVFQESKGFSPRPNERVIAEVKSTYIPRGEGDLMRGNGFWNLLTLFPNSPSNGAPVKSDLTKILLHKVKISNNTKIKYSNNYKYIRK